MRVPRTMRTRGSLLASAAAALALAGGATAVAVGPLGQADRTADLAGQIDASKPKNVILLIGDGTDEAIITAARNYEKGAGGRFVMDDMPFTGDMTTYGLRTGTGPDYPIAYVSDSAPTASAWSTGRKTVDSRLSQGPSVSDTTPGEDYETVLEQYRKQGKRTGNVSTAELTDATPAAAAAHINLRECKGPQNMARCTAAQKKNGGKGSVAEQLVDNKVDVLLGGARGSFTQATDAGPTVLDYAKTTHGYRDIATKTDLDAVTSLKDGPVLGLFASGNMTPQYKPLLAVAGGTGGAEGARCEAADRGTQPTLEQMTRKAITLLDQDNDKGFFLQVESAMVDKQEHAIDACGAIGDLAELDRSVEAALEYQAKHPDTLVIVTGDHSHSTQIVDGTGSGRQTVTLKTADGDPMYVAYSTGIAGSGHTGSQIRVAAKGPQAANVTGLIDQTDLYDTLQGRSPSKLPEGPTKTVTTPGPTTTVTGPTTTVPGPTTTVPGPPAAVKLSAGLAVPRQLSNAAARSGIPVSLVSTKAGTARVTVKSGGRTLAAGATKLGANEARSFKLSGRRIARSRAATLKVSVTVTAGTERTTRTATVSVSRR